MSTDDKWHQIEDDFLRLKSGGLPDEEIYRHLSENMVSHKIRLYMVLI